MVNIQHARVHFAYMRPIGARGHSFRKVTQTALERSVYYWWWEYLRRNEQYKKCCENRGRGPLAKLYADFGDVHESDFVQWWRNEDKGARLFAEPVRLLRFEELEGPDEIRSGWDRQKVAVISVPLDVSQTYLRDRFNQLLARRHGKKPGMSYAKKGESKARYKVDTPPVIKSLKQALKAWDLRQEDPNAQLWKLAMRMGLMKHLHFKHDAPARQTVDARKELAIAYSKIYKKAKRWIEGTAKGRFPAK